MQIRLDHVGHARAPVLVIDDAWTDVQSLIEIAVGRSDYAVRALYYPGLRSSAPPDYARQIVAALSDTIRSTFGLRGELAITDSTFSLVATAPEKLVPFQRVPHFDSVDQNGIAVLHYLCGSGGTSFYRHRSTGIETVTAQTQDAYIRTVNAEVAGTGMPPAQYMDGDTPLFERIAKYDAVMNRALLYRGSMLHSVNVSPDFVPDTNPRTGRLTANTFLTVYPQIPP
jgi:Family of unknown function (DUF6445)